VKLKASRVINGLAIEDENGSILATISILRLVPDEKYNEVVESIEALFSGGVEQQVQPDNSQKCQGTDCDDCNEWKFNPGYCRLT
jgi:hypothetical protein